LSFATSGPWPRLASKAVKHMLDVHIASNQLRALT
jgi:hypothetical protein